jgi:hypothetical protein
MQFQVIDRVPLREVVVKADAPAVFVRVTIRGAGTCLADRIAVEKK